MLRTTKILHVPVSVVDMETAAAEIGQWVSSREGRYVCAADVNSIMQAQRNRAHGEALRGAAMVVPDGTPLIWTARARGERHMRRVPGPDLMLELCAAGTEKGWGH
jgi:N-acetylglucosaminyldiphosphoundecaprenol N-acetyl-beta-D-mannosaminyltransferase